MKKSNLLYSLRFIIPGAILIYSILFISINDSNYKSYEKLLIKKETDFATIEFQKNITDLILEKAKILTSLAELSDRVIPSGDFRGDEKRFHQITDTLIKNKVGFSAITLINRNGYIFWISPREGNQDAIGKHPLSYQEVASYLKAARDTRSPQLSHVLQVYEDYDAFIIYVPIYQKNEFRGWINGVFNYEDYFDQFFQDRFVENLYVQLSWIGYPAKSYIFGDKIGDTLDISTKFEVLNQTMELKVDLQKYCIISEKRRVHEILIIFSYLTSILVSLIMYKQIKARYELTVINKKLKRDKTLLNILSHDLAAPLTLITENTMKLKDQSSDSTEVTRILKAANRLKDLLSRVRSFHATNLGRIKLYLEPCHPKDLINESISLFEDQLRNKHVTCSVHVPDNTSECIADRIIAIHNVLGNVLSNAIKFTETGGAIEINVHEEAKYIVINIQDKGIGIPKEILNDLFDETQKASTTGTMGEMGTGLGMLQIKSFMEYFDGKLKIDTSPKGTKVSLYFKRA